MWLKFQCKRDHSMVSGSTQENQSPAKLVSMKFFDAREMILVETHCKGFFYLLSIVVRGKRKECVGSIW